MKRGEKVGMALAAMVILGVALSPFLMARYWRFYYHDASPELQSKLPAPPECYVPPDVAVDGYAEAQARAWNDLDADGVLDGSEAALPGVIVMLQYSRNIGFYDPEKPFVTRAELASQAPGTLEYARLTDEHGLAGLWMFRPGCTGHCWADLGVAAWAPAGYEATTATWVNLTSEQEVVSFGFRKTEP